MAAKVKKGFGFRLYQFLVIYPGFIQAMVDRLCFICTKLFFVINHLS